MSDCETSSTLPPAPVPGPKEPLKPGKDWPANNSTTPSRALVSVFTCGLVAFVCGLPLLLVARLPASLMLAVGSCCVALSLLRGEDVANHD
jgi:hypothetical protein